MKKTAIVSGAAMGYKKAGPSIGGAISIRLAREGYNVIVADILKRGQDTVEIIRKNGGEAVFVRADVTDGTEVKKVIQTAKSKFGGLNCLVNCVARYSSGMAKSVSEITVEEWDKTFKVNLGGYFLMAKHSVPLILASGGGTIINISSVAALMAIPDFSIYNVTKAAINGLTRSLAVDFAPKIRTNAILPGFVRIENSQNNRSKKELEDWYGRIASKYPLKRVCEVEEIASVAAFLAGNDSSYINGQTIVVDGGKSIMDPHEF